MRCPICGNQMKEEYYDKYPGGYGGISYQRCLNRKGKHHKWWTCEEVESDNTMVIDIIIRSIDRNQFYKDIKAIYEIPEELIIKRELEDLVAEAKENGDKTAIANDFEVILPIKCGGCNWETSHLYVYARNQKEAEEIFKAHDGGMCGKCMTEFLAEDNKEVSRK